jgi:hypothetical protein
MEEKDEHFVSTLFEEGQWRMGLRPHTFDDWDNVMIFLKFFFLKKKKLMTQCDFQSLYVTSNMYFSRNSWHSITFTTFSESGNYLSSIMA